VDLGHILVVHRLLQHLPVVNALLQRRFIVSTGNLSLVPASETDTICEIQEFAHFLCQLSSTDTKNSSLMTTVIT
jgi:hypothetical protein